MLLNVNDCFCLNSRSSDVVNNKKESLFWLQKERKNTFERKRKRVYISKKMKHEKCCKLIKSVHRLQYLLPLRPHGKQQTLEEVGAGE